MAEDTRTSDGRARHFDRGFAAARWALGGAVLLAACSGNLSKGDPGTGGTRSSSGDAGMTGTTGQSGTGWVSVGDAGAGGWNTQGSAGVNGTSGTFGSSAGSTGGCSFPFNGPGCPPGNCAAGTGNCGAPSGGTGGSGSSTGTGGTSGTTSLPACVDRTPSFGVCFVSTLDVLPLPNRIYDPGVSTSGTAEIYEVGTGPAPGSCESARWFGAPGTSDWWLRAEAATGGYWIIGVHGLGPAPLANVNDYVNLNLSWRGYGIAPGYGGPYGELLLESLVNGPLLWASSDKNTTSWVQLTTGAAVCKPTRLCIGDQTDVIATINGSTMTVPSFGSTSLGGFFLAVGESHAPIVRNNISDCADYYNPSRDAAAVRLAVTGP